jgi:serine/threonine-protein kinase
MNQPASFGGGRPIIPVGTQLNGIYEVDEPIAAGGMGEIYRGHAIQTGDPVAIKLIRSDLAESEAAFALFRKEASALHNLYHEAIVRYYVFTVDPVLERPYLAMEFVDGQSLSAMLRSGPLAVEAVHRLMQRIAAGLNAAHERGIIHRDVSPDNIIIPGGDMARAKIIDFGIARSTRLGDDGTVIGSGFAGKYLYVSPEQLGLFGGEVTPKSDIYSLGLVLAEALRDNPIDMGGNLVEVVEKRRQVPDLGPIDGRLRPLIEHMLQPNPDDRPESMAEVAAWSITTAPPPRRPRETASSVKPAKSRAPLLIGGGAALALVAAAGAYMALRPAPQPERPSRPPVLVPDRKETAQLPQRGGTPGDNGPIKGGLAPPPDLAPLPRGSGDADFAGLVGTGSADVFAGSRIEATTRYIARYDGGDCFFVKPIAVNAARATIEGFGASTAPFRTLDDAFRRSNGFEADIGVRQVAPGQCPAVTFLGHLRGGAPPSIDLNATALKVGQSLNGIVSGLDDRQLALLLVADDGSVRSVPTIPRPDKAASFSLPVGADLGSGRLEMLVAVVSPRPLGSLRNARLPAADKLFPTLLTEASGAAATARAFKVDR